MNMTFQSCVKIINEWDIVAARQLGRKYPKKLALEPLTKQELQLPSVN